MRGLHSKHFNYYTDLPQSPQRSWPSFAVLVSMLNFPGCKMEQPTLLTVGGELKLDFQATFQTRNQSTKNKATTWSWEKSTGKEPYLHAINLDTGHIVFWKQRPSAQVRRTCTGSNGNPAMLLYQTRSVYPSSTLPVDSENKRGT